MTAAARRMWAGGPCRRWSVIRESGCTMPLAGGDFGGSYVCDGCQVPAGGLRRVIRLENGQETWLCARCQSRPARQ